MFSTARKSSIIPCPQLVVSLFSQKARIPATLLMDLRVLQKGGGGEEAMRLRELRTGEKMPNL